MLGTHHDIQTIRMTIGFAVISLLLLFGATRLQLSKSSDENLLLNQDVCLSDDLARSTNASAYGDDMVAWFRSKGGFWSDKLEIRRRDPDDPSSPFGIFAKSAIGLDETIVDMPRNLFLAVPRQATDNHYEDACRLSKRLLKETRLYRQSPTSTELAPYIRYLEETQMTGQLPSTYSPEGKTLLRKIQGIGSMGDDFWSDQYGDSPLPPAGLVDWMDSFVEDKCIEADDQDAIHSIALTIQRGFGCELLPVWDFVNHDVQERVNVEDSSLESLGVDENYKVRTTRPIEAGEEILYSYNFCADCGDGNRGGTPGMYRDFGFVEDYPQLWPFEDHDIFAKVHKNDEDGSYYAELYDEEGEVDADEQDDDSIAFLQTQLERLRSLDMNVEMQSVYSSLEQTMIRQFYDSFVVALASVIEALEKQRLKQLQKGDGDNSDDKHLLHDDALGFGGEMVAWFRSKGGFWSDKLEIRRRDPNDPSSPFGIFAKSTIGLDKTIVEMPRNLFLAIPREPSEEEEDDTFGGKSKDERGDRGRSSYGDKYVETTCRLSKRLLEETRLYRQSPTSTEFAPYIRYLEETQMTGQLPTTYSPEGKSLLRKIQGIGSMRDDFWSDQYGVSPLPPADLVDWMDLFVKSGCVEADDQDGIHSIALTIQRGFDSELLPLWDFVNHDVEERVNVEESSLKALAENENYEVWTTRRIKTGEEILFSYNLCADCDDNGYLSGTPGIYRDFGFIEDYPQLWPFVDYGVFARIHKNDEDGSYYADFYDPDDGGLDVNDLEEAIEFLHIQLKRLRGLDIDDESQSVQSSFERTMIQKFYISLVIALASTIEALVQRLSSEHVAIDEPLQ